MFLFGFGEGCESLFEGWQGCKAGELEVEVGHGLFVFDGVFKQGPISLGDIVMKLLAARQNAIRFIRGKLQ